MSIIRNNSSDNPRGLNQLVFDLDSFRTSVNKNASSSNTDKYLKDHNRKWNSYSTLKLTESKNNLGALHHENSTNNNPKNSLNYDKLSNVRESK